MKKDVVKSDDFEMEIEISSELLRSVESLADNLNMSVNECYCAALEEFIKRYKSQKRGELSNE